MTSLSPSALRGALLRRVGLIAIALLAASPLRAHAEPSPIAPLEDRVVDEVGFFSPGERVRLRQKLTAFERERKVQFVVAILSSLGDEDIAQRALRMAEAWRLGRRGSDDGLLLVVAPKERQVRFEVGYGLESELTDAQASRFLEEARVAHPEGPTGEGVIELASMAIGFLESRLPPPSVRRAVAEPLVDPSLGLALGGAVAAFALLWLTFGRKRMAALPYRPLRPPYRRQPGHAGSFRDSLLYSILLGWLFGGGRGRRGGGGSNDNDRGGPPRGGGGGFGGGGASGRW